MLRPLPLVLLGVLLLPLAQAQTFSNPIEGAYADVYVVTGRIVDSEGNPAAGAELLVELSQRGVDAKPLRARANCYGDYITAFNLKAPEATGSVRVTVKGKDGGEDVSASVKLDPFYRRSDQNVRIPYRWEYVCTEEKSFWPGRISVTGRVVNRTEPYDHEGTTLHAKPGVGYVRVRFIDSLGRTFCPPAQDPSQCQPIPIDERGDFRYSFTFSETIDPKGSIEILFGEKRWNQTIDADFRIATHKIELSGQGPPQTKPTPPAAFLPALAVVALAALALRRRRG